tara:strand:- start:600 stop:782 length:183 start_codon:yes stop_codon:yes gene_type:complete
MLTKDEVTELSGEFFELADRIQAARDVDSSGGRRITKAEAKSIGMQALRLGLELIKQVID